MHQQDITPSVPVGQWQREVEQYATGLFGELCDFEKIFAGLEEHRFSLLGTEAVNLALRKIGRALEEFETSLDTDAVILVLEQAIGQARDLLAKRP